jgi:hypothetical protein
VDEAMMAEVIVYRELLRMAKHILFYVVGYVKCHCNAIVKICRNADATDTAFKMTADFAECVNALDNVTAVWTH